MANLGFFEIDTEGEYVTLEEATGLTLTVGTKYYLQVQNGLGYLVTCVSDTKPQKGGFLMNNTEKFNYTHANGVNLYLNSNGTVYLNVAE